MKREIAALVNDWTTKRMKRNDPCGAIRALRSDSTGCDDQSQSPLFSVIPPEIRNDIFKYALAEVETEDNQYHPDTCFRRPGYLAPHRTYTDLLRTCKRIYSEAWHLPWAGAEHVFYFAWDGRKPQRTVEVEDVQDKLTVVHDSQGEQEIDHIRIFAQLVYLEDGSRIRDVCNMDNFHPRSVTVTIRHTDFWNWEDDEPMRLAGTWMSWPTELPNSVREFNLDLESIEQRKASVDYLADNIAERWHVKRKDGSVLVPDRAEKSVMRWTGSSTWEGSRWISDEVRHLELDYYVRTVTFRPSAARCDERSLAPTTINPDIEVPQDIAARTRLNPPNIHVYQLREWGVPLDADAEVIRKIWAGEAEWTDTEDDEGDDRDDDGDDDEDDGDDGDNEDAEDGDDVDENNDQSRNVVHFGAQGEE